MDHSRAAKPTWAVHYESVLLRHHLPRAYLKHHPDLGGAEQFLSPQITNPSFLTPEERDVLIGLLSNKDRRAAGWPTVGAARRRRG